MRHGPLNVTICVCHVMKSIPLCTYVYVPFPLHLFAVPSIFYKNTNKSIHLTTYVDGMINSHIVLRTIKFCNCLIKIGIN